jgi:glucose-6-phosphate 1-dehydrogenase
MPDFKPKVKIQGDFCIEVSPGPAALVIFGASGDLTRRKLIPALFNLYHRKLLPKNFYILGAARTAMDDDAFRDRLRASLSDVPPEQANTFLGRCFYHAGDYHDPAFYQELSGRLDRLDGDFATGGNRLFYLSTPPSLYAPIVQLMQEASLSTEPEDRSKWVRVVIEKPFGHDLPSALKLDHQLHRTLKEYQIYRIDHYLGKETVQNIMMLRFANAIFEPIWNRRYIDHVQITVAESIGVGSRAGYFEQAGVLRDMFQNHMLQMLALVAMEPPPTFEAASVRNEKVQLLRSIHPMTSEEIDRFAIRAQYGPGQVDGEETPGYRQEEGVAADSHVETFAAVRLMIENWRWQGVPFYLRSGKRLARRASEIAITFKRVPHSMFRPIGPEDLAPNVLVLHVQPDEGISLTMQAKHPGPKLCMSSLNMDFTYSEVFGEESPDAYERLLLDALLGDQTLFIRADVMEVAWSLIDPIMERWADKSDPSPLHTYPPGSCGPTAADPFMAQDGRQWRDLTRE